MSLWKCETANVESTDPRQRTCSMEESMFESFHKNENLIEHTVSQGNIHEPESRRRRSLEAAKANPITSVYRGKKGVTEIGKLHL